MYHFWVLRTSFLKPRTLQVFTPIQTDLLKPENGLLKYGNNQYFRGVRKKNFHRKIFKFVAGQKMADEDKSS